MKFSGRCRRMLLFAYDEDAFYAKRFHVRQLEANWTPASQEGEVRLTICREIAVNKEITWTCAKS